MRGAAGIWAGICLTLIATAAPVEAAPTSAKDRAAAQALVQKAKAAAKAKKWSEAAELLQKADQLDPSPQTELDLGRALAASGKLVEAKKTFKALAAAPATTAGARKIKDSAGTAVTDLEPKIPSLRVTAKPADAKVTVDGTVIDAALEIPLDPGDHQVGVEADGFESSTRSVTLQEASHERITVSLNRAAAAVAEAPKESSGGGEGGSRAPAYVAFGVGAVGLGLGAVFGGLAFSASSDAKSLCRADQCPPSASDKIDASKRDGDISTVAFIAGGAGVATGIVLLLIIPSKKPSVAPESASIQPYFGAGQVGLSGRF